MADNFSGVYRAVRDGPWTLPWAASNDAWVVTNLSYDGTQYSAIDRATGEVVKYFEGGGGAFNGEYIYNTSGGNSFNFVTEAMMPAGAWVSDDGLIAKLFSVNGYLKQLTVAHSEAPTTPISSASGIQIFASYFGVSVLAGHRDELILRTAQGAVSWVTWDATTFTEVITHSFPALWSIGKVKRMSAGVYRVFAYKGDDWAVVDITTTTATHVSSGYGLLDTSGAFDTYVDFIDILAGTKDTVTPGVSTGATIYGSEGAVMCDSLADYLQMYLFISTDAVPYGDRAAAEIDPLVLDKAAAAYSHLLTPTVTSSTGNMANWASSPLSLTLSTGVTFYTGAPLSLIRITDIPDFWTNFYGQYEA
jgi:hypothetical protein